LFTTCQTLQINPDAYFFPSGTRSENRYLSWHAHGHADPEVDLCGLEFGLC